MHLFNRMVLLTAQLQVLIDDGHWFRAAGECICPVCGKEYQHHTHLRIEGYEWLNLLCNGWIIKL